MTDTVQVTLSLPLADAHLERVRAVSSRLEVTLLSRAQQTAFRGGGALWAGYGGSARDDGESPEEAATALRSVLARTHVLLCNPVVPADLLERAAGLRWLQLSSAGIDRLSGSPLLRSKLLITTASGVHAAPVSEYVIGMMIALAKRLPDAMRAKAEASWSPYPADELAGRTVGIVGAGHIGSRIGLVAKALGMRVIGIRVPVAWRGSGGPSIDELLPPSELHRLMAESDYVVLCLPLTEETRGLIGAPELAVMKPTAFLVNSARGPVIDEEALIEALREKRIAGAALDVFAEEPLAPESELWRLENVIVTPHISGGSPRVMERVVDLFCDNMRHYLSGDPMFNVFDSKRGF